MRTSPTVKAGATPHGRGCTCSPSATIAARTSDPIPAPLRRRAASCSSLQSPWALALDRWLTSTLRRTTPTSLNGSPTHEASPTSAGYAGDAAHVDKGAAGGSTASIGSERPEKGLAAAKLYLLALAEQDAASSSARSEVRFSDGNPLAAYTNRFQMAASTLSRVLCAFDCVRGEPTMIKVRHNQLVHAPQLGAHTERVRVEAYPGG